MMESKELHCEHFLCAKPVLGALNTSFQAIPAAGGCGRMGCPLKLEQLTEAKWLDSVELG